MELIFVCFRKNKIFKSSNFDFLENKGIKIDENGNKFLDARIILTDPCPVCGEKHVYHVNELTCPFNV